MTPDLADYRPTSAMPERDLLDGYSRMPGRVPFGRIEPCACGGEIAVSDAQDWAEVAAALLKHYRTAHGRATT